MANYLPPDGHHVVLNFTDLATGSTDLNFGKDQQNLAKLDVIINTQFLAHLKAQSFDFNGLDATLNTGFIAEFEAVTGQIATLDAKIQTGFVAQFNAVQINNRAQLDVVIDTRWQVQFDALFDIHHVVGVGLDFNVVNQNGMTTLNAVDLTHQDATTAEYAYLLPLQHAQTTNHLVDVGFERGLTLLNTLNLKYENSKQLTSNAALTWQENFKIQLFNALQFDRCVVLQHKTELFYQEMIRKRRHLHLSHQVARQLDHYFYVEWDKGFELATQDHLVWQYAKAVHYRKHPILPWPKPQLPKYQGSTDLQFVCLCENDAHDLILNFGQDNCIPALANQKGWYIVNTLSVSRLDNGEEILVYDGNYSTDRSRWCWSYSLTVPESEIIKLEPIDLKPVILKIVVNGNEHHMLLENRSRSRQFGKTTYVLTGRSQTALLSEPYAPVRSFLQENERTSVQLCQAELDRIFSETVLNWQLLDELGWIVANNSLSYTNLAPMAVIKMVAESGGGFVYSEKNSNTLSIKPLYKKTFWDALQIEDYDRLVPESIVLNQSTDYELYPDYNGITLTNDRSGQHAQVKRRETSADVLLPPENNPLFDHVSMGGFGKAKLAKAGMIETHTLNMPISQQVGECVPGEILAFNAQWWGIVDSVSVSFNYAKVSQSIKVERVNRE